MPLPTRTHFDDSGDSDGVRGRTKRKDLKPVFDDRVESVYLDNAATTMMAEEVVAAMRPYHEESFGNPETPYHLGREASDAVEVARERIAELLGADSGEIVFTSGGTESNNWAVRCAGDLTKYVWCSAIEHDSVLRVVPMARRIDPIPVEKSGRLDPESLREGLESTGPGVVGLVSVQHANNEIGTLQDIPAIAEVCHEYGALLHVDAVQTFGKMRFDVDDLGADLVSLSAHKIHGPMGIGALYIRPGVKIEPFMRGGGQELERRSGTLAVPSIVGFGMAAELARTTVRTEEPRLRSLLKSFLTEAKVKFEIEVNGDQENCAPHIASIMLPGVEAGIVAAVLNRQYGICVSCGSACGTRNVKSHVLQAIGRTTEQMQRTMRVSFSRFTTKRHVRSLISGLHMAIREAKERSFD